MNTKFTVNLSKTRIFSYLLVLGLISACSSDDITEQQTDLTTSTQGEQVINLRQAYGNAENKDSTTSSQQAKGTDLYSAEPLPKNINFYTRGMMQELISNLQYVNENTPVAISSFIYLDGPEDQASLLGKQIAESLLHEVHKAGIPVLDHKVTDYMRVTPNGDFVITRDFNELTSNIEVQYVFTGTLVKHQGGYLANSRVVGINSKAVVASAQSFIPAQVADALLDSQYQTESGLVPLKQASN